MRYGEVHSAVPVTELLGVSADGVGLPAGGDLRLRVSGWGRLDAADRRVPTGDLEFGFLQARLLGRRLTLSAGRHAVVGGAARYTQVDGASADARLWGGFGVSGYGGLPVVPRFAAAFGDGLAGGRVYWRRSVNTEVGASFLQMWSRGNMARQDAGLDLRIQPWKLLSFAGFGLWSVAEERLAEVDVGPTWVVGPRVQLSANYRRTAPDLFLPRTSIFSVFAETQRDEAGGSVQWQAFRRVGLFLEYHSLWTGDGRGDDPAARVSYRSDSSGTTTATVEARWLRAPKNRYVGERLAASHRFFSRLTLAADLEGYQFAEPINGATTSMSAAVTGAYAVGPKWLAALTGTAGVTPLLERRFEVMAKLVYNFSTTTRGQTE